MKVHLPRLVYWKFIVPVQLSQYIFRKKLIKPFAIYLYLKFFAGDRVSKDNPVFASLRQDLKMRDRKNRTFRKHLQKLLDLTWIRYEPESGTYLIRSLNYIIAINGFENPKATFLIHTDILQLQQYLVAAIMSGNISDQKYRRRMKRLGKALKIRKGGRQSTAYFRSLRITYCGIGNKKIGQLLGCKRTRACQLKLAAVRAGYIEARHKFRQVAILPEPDFGLRLKYANGGLENHNGSKKAKFPIEANKLRFHLLFQFGKKTIVLALQLYDHIIPRMDVIPTTRFKSTELKVPPTH